MKTRNQEPRGMVGLRLPPEVIDSWKAIAKVRGEPFTICMGTFLEYFAEMDGGNVTRHAAQLGEYRARLTELGSECERIAEKAHEWEERIKKGRSLVADLENVYEKERARYIFLRGEVNALHVANESAREMAGEVRKMGN